MASGTLSQSEIDRLLGGASNVPFSGASEESPVQMYDFRRPHRVSKERLRTLEAIYERLVKSLESWVIGRVRGQIEMRLQGVEQFSFGPPNNFIESSTVYHSADGTFTIPATPEDRRVESNGWATFHVNGVQVRQTAPAEVFYETPKSPTTLQWFQETVAEVVDAVQGLRDVANQFGDRAGPLIAALNAELGIIDGGLAGALRKR